MYGMYRLIAKHGLTDPRSAERYMEKIHEITRGYLLWLFEMEDQPEWSWKLKLSGGTEYPSPNKEDEEGCQYDYYFKQWCAQLMMLHRFMELFPEEQAFGRRMLRQWIKKYWKQLEDGRDKDCDLWGTITTDELDGLPLYFKHFSLETQVVIWMSMEAAKHLMTLSPESDEDDKVLALLKEFNPDDFRGKIFEQFRAESGKWCQDKKSPLLYLVRGGYGQCHHELIPDEECEFLVYPALNRNFFLRDDAAGDLWKNTLRQQYDWKWDPGSINSSTESLYVRLPKSGRLAVMMLYYIWAPARSSSDEEQYSSRKLLERAAAANGIFIGESMLSCTEKICFDVASCLLYTDYAVELGSVQFTYLYNMQIS
jgi:hypothetical protein